jgi:hypothetical protein
MVCIQKARGSSPLSSTYFELLSPRTAAEPRASLSRLSAASGASSGTIVYSYSSIVMAILLCRRIRIATRGCTSKAAPLTLELLLPQKA